MNSNLKAVFLSVAVSTYCLSGNAQNNSNDLIAASQSGSSPLFFKPMEADISLVKLVDFSSEIETNVRRGIPNFFEKARTKRELTVAYIGGSITQAQNQYRMQSLRFIQQMLPKVKIVGINAGVAGSDTELAACRIKEQVLDNHPDLIFIEFAVNGGFPDGMEGMVRQIMKFDSKIDICFIYTVMSAQLKYYQTGDQPPGIKTLEKIASHYNIPSIHLGMAAADLAKNEKLIIKGNPKDNIGKIIFSADGVHPIPEGGGKLYAEALARGMVKLQSDAPIKVNDFPKPLFQDNWEDAKMITPSEKMFSSGWKKIDSSTSNYLKSFKNWFPSIMTSDRAGDSFTFNFKGKAFGFFDVGGPESGQMDIYLDGKLIELKAIKNDKLFTIVEDGITPLNRFTAYSNNRYRGQYFLIQTEDKVHTVTFKISATMADKKKILGPSKQKDITENFEKYNRSVLYLGKILIRGEMVN